MRLFGAARRSRLLNTSGSSWEALRDLAHERVPLPLGAKEFRKETARVSSERRLTGGLPPFHDVRGTSLSQPCAVSCRRAIHLRVGSRSSLFGDSTEHMAPADAVCPDSQAVVDGFLVDHAGLAPRLRVARPDRRGWLSHPSSEGRGNRPGACWSKLLGATIPGHSGVRPLRSSEHSRRVATVDAPATLRCGRCGSPR